MADQLFHIILCSLALHNWNTSKWRPAFCYRLQNVQNTLWFSLQAKNAMQCSSNAIETFLYVMVCCTSVIIFCFPQYNSATYYDCSDLFPLSTIGEAKARGSVWCSEVCLWDVYIGGKYYCCYCWSDGYIGMADHCSCMGLMDISSFYSSPSGVEVVILAS